MDKKQLPVALLHRETTWGFRYLLFQLVFLGPLLILILKLLGLNTNYYLDTAYFTINLIAVVWIFHSFLWKSLKHSIRHCIKLLLAAVIGITVYYVLFHGLDYIIHQLMPGFFNVNDAAIAEDSRNNFVLTAVGTVLLVPLTEEVLYRGLIFGALHKRSRLLAYALSVLLFAFVHIMGYFGYYQTEQLLLSFVQYIPAGLALAWAYEYSGSILAPVIIHIAVNAIAIFNPF